MSKRGRFIKNAFKHIYRETAPIVEAAVRTGIGRVGSQLADVSVRRATTPELLLGNVASALRSGLIAAGHELMSGGLKRVRETDEVALPPVEPVHAEADEPVMDAMAEPEMEVMEEPDMDAAAASDVESGSEEPK